MTLQSVMINPSETAKWLLERDDFLVIAHRRPDGDALGCASALAHGLRECGKTAYVMHNPETTERYVQIVEDYWQPDGYAPENIITVDTASRSLFPSNAEEYKDAVTLCIDHHGSNELYAKYTCLAPERAACGEVVFDILNAMPCGVSAPSAERLYIALTTDTGCFTFANTTANTLRVAASLIDAGAPYVDLNKALFRTKTRGRVRIEAKINEGIEFLHGGKVAIAAITKEMMNVSGATENDMDDIASLPGYVEGVICWITIRELDEADGCKISVRTAPTVSAQDICSAFGGGGHPLAAGFSSMDSVEQIKDKLRAVIADFLPE